MLNMKNSTYVKNALVLGLALFAMFFGAGNLIFPPQIGLDGGTSWPVGFLAYFIADVALALVSIAAMLKANGSMELAVGSAGKKPAMILNTAIILCIGPLLAIPRTGATSFEMMSTALTGSADNRLALAMFSVVFFAVVLFAALNPGKVIDRVGKILTPLLVIVLAVLIIAGILNPAAQAAAPATTQLIEEGVLNGYQTMDMLAGLAFAIIAVQTVKGFKYEEKKSERSTIVASCGISAALLFVIYGGLALLGATTGQLWADGVADGSVGQATFLSNISSAILGGTGSIVLSAVVVLACLTTAIGVASACSEYFVGLFNGRISYRTIVTIICAFSMVLCNVGLSQILQISAPILTVVYPVALYLVVAYIVRKDGNHPSLACRFGAAVAFVISLASVLCDTCGIDALSFVHQLPLDNFGFNWLTPAIVATAVGFIISRLLRLSGRSAKASR